MVDASGNRHTRRVLCKVAILLVATVVPSCTYGPAEHRAVAYAARVDRASTRMVVVVHHEIFRPPTGLTAFPDGGVARTTLHELVIYGADAATRSVALWQRRDVDRELWSALDLTIVGATPDTVYVALSGCPAEADECWGPGRKRVLTRLTADGGHEVVESVPPRHRDHGQPDAPEPTEAVFLRVGAKQHDTISASLGVGEERVPLLRVLPTGEVVPVRR